MDSMQKCVSCSQRPRDGRFLRCFHVACAACVEEHTHGNGTRVCPRCAVSTETQSSIELPRVPEELFVDGGDACLPAAGQWCVQAAPRPASLCDECTEDTAASHQCLHCRFVLCSEHATSHPKRRAFAGHEVAQLPSAAVASTRSRAAVAAADVKCPLHPRVAMRSYCEPCAELVCERCVETGAHRGVEHRVRPALDAAKQLLELMRRQYGEPSGDVVGRGENDAGGDDAINGDGARPPPPTAPEWDVCRRLQARSADVETALRAVQLQQETISAAMEAVFAEERAKMERNESTLRDKLEAIGWRQLKALEEQKEEIGQSLLSGQRAIAVLRHYSAGDGAAERAGLLRLSRWLAAGSRGCEAVASQRACLVPSIRFDEDECRRKASAGGGAVDSSCVLDCAVCPQRSTAVVRVRASEFGAKGGLQFSELLPPEHTLYISVAARNGSSDLLDSGSLPADNEWRVRMSLPDGRTFSFGIEVAAPSATSSATCAASGDVAAAGSARPSGGFDPQRPLVGFGLRSAASSPYETPLPADLGESTPLPADLWESAQPESPEPSKLVFPGSSAGKRLGASTFPALKKPVFSLRRITPAYSVPFTSAAPAVDDISASVRLASASFSALESKLTTSSALPRSSSSSSSGGASGDDTGVITAGNGVGIRYVRSGDSAPTVAVDDPSSFTAVFAVERKLGKTPIRVDVFVNGKPISVKPPEISLVDTSRPPAFSGHKKKPNRRSS